MPGNRKKVHWGEDESLKRPRILALASSGEEKRRSIEMCIMRMRHDAMSGCAGYNQNKIAKLPRTSLTDNGHQNPACLEICPFRKYSVTPHD